MIRATPINFQITKLRCSPPLYIYAGNREEIWLHTLTPLFADDAAHSHIWILIRIHFFLTKISIYQSVRTISAPRFPIKNILILEPPSNVEIVRIFLGQGPFSHDVRRQYRKLGHTRSSPKRTNGEKRGRKRRRPRGISYYSIFTKMCGIFTRCQTKGWTPFNKQMAHIAKL